jgi:hypothetical protein
MPSIAFARSPRLWRCSTMSQPPRASFSLKGPSITLDPRVHAVRGDLADIALAGQLFAPHYAKPVRKQCAVASVMIQDSPGAGGKAISQLLLGEDFMLVDVTGGWAWGYCRHDHYVGYLPETALKDPVEDEGAVVSVREASLFVSPADDAPVSGSLPMGAVTHGAADNGFVGTPLGFVKASALDRSFDDAVAVAETLIDVPYVWGGRGGNGIDCSGLLQLSLALTGKSAPRDSDQQQAVLGTEIAADAPLLRGDVIFFPGHVGIMADSNDLVHATMHWGKVVREPLSDVIARFSAEHETPVLARRRLA